MTGSRGFSEPVKAKRETVSSLKAEVLQGRGAAYTQGWGKLPPLCREQHEGLRPAGLVSILAPALLAADTAPPCPPSLCITAKVQKQWLESDLAIHPAR